ncbi:GNAT family N-acetyltransferase [Emcibacter nanhaiensis]|uniref:N-acetyltransferase n=1 Tax=Emcibacter nanhaiensis TaxID=1505037 RepID=A0A501PSQ1_9PROT|nr:GNAT family N-acetyltransferase [Emcibacter nanhaiensis]TPD63178.1 N-acetyltransferase [Emcibacter nanhaiensis]
MATVRIIDSLSKIDAESWNACALQADSGHNPFVSHEFLRALEASGCATAETGWLGQHIIIEDNDRVIGVMPLYLKSHSYGEYVFDHSWANAYERAGGRYYPKLQSSVPFSPVTSPRLMVHPAADRQETGRLLTRAAIQRCQDLDLSSLHVTFAPEDEWQLMADCGMLQRQDQQFHWLNDGYQSFDDFLAALSSRKRKNIRKERREALSGGVTIERLTGKEITEEHWDHYFSFYMDTANRKWGRPYLNREFFSRLGESLADRILLVMCRRAGHYMAGALNLVGDDTLYGRYWGAIEDHRFLHFEVCYYQAIDYAIEKDLAKVEAGAQGEHKLARGYVPSKTYSAHWIGDESFREAIDRFLRQERGQVEGEMDFLEHFTPFKKG